MTRLICVLLSTFVFSLTCSAQDYSLSHFQNGRPVVNPELAGKVIKVGKLPSDIFESEEDEEAASQPIPADNTNHYFNIAVLAGFAGLLILGGTITGVCVHSKRRMKASAPMTMVGV